jgi:hypothetical protein
VVIVFRGGYCACGLDSIAVAAAKHEGAIPNPRVSEFGGILHVHAMAGVLLLRLFVN